VNRIGLATGLALLSTASACAQWQGSVGTGVRQVHILERDPQGQQLVRERGLIPGVHAAATYHVDDWRLSLRGELYRASVGYQGQSQAGPGLISNTATTQSRMGTGHCLCPD
jgi:hypothetical protein